MRHLPTTLIYFAVIARAIGWHFETAPIPALIWLLLILYGVILLTEELISRRFPSYPRLYTLIQSILAICMLYIAPTIDFLPMLLYQLSFQAVQFFRGWIGFAWIAGFGLAMSGMFLFGLELQAGVTMVVGGTAVNLLMGSFSYLMKRTGRKRQENQAAFKELQQAYRQLRASADKTELMAAATERHRLVRELHDSLTQTLFSMNMAAQAAGLSISEAPSRVDGHLAHLQSLARNAGAEVQALTGKVKIPQSNTINLAEALRTLAEERLLQDGLHIELEVRGNRLLPSMVEANLYRIAQEALNNISRHSGVQQAALKLILDVSPACLEVSDQGCGFDPSKVHASTRYGLAGMRERAVEIGWDLQVESTPGVGTRIRVEEKS